jgi:hypothetical protein
MAASTDIANLCLEILGLHAVTSITDQSNPGRAINTTYDLVRKALLTGRPTWRFSVKRASLAASTIAPVSGPYTQQFLLPADCLRVQLAGDTWPGMDLTDYRQGPTDIAYSVEGRYILCDYGAPLSLQYIYDCTDTTQMDPWFVMYFAATLAWTCCETLTGSDAKQQAADMRRKDALSQAAGSNALVSPPVQPADDTWILSRLA